MAEFTPGQRVTASQLNNLFDNATEGNHSNTSIVNGKIINNPIGLQYKELYSAPRFLDIKYCCSNYRFEGEDDNINQHTYINIIDAENQWIRTDGYYYEYERDKTRWVFMYSDGEKAIVRVVTNQDLDINTDLNTRQLDTYVKNYEPKTTYSGYIETPIPPETNIYIAELGLYTESDARVGGIFLIYGNKEQDEFITEPIQAKIIKELNDSGFWKYEGQSQDIDKLLSECGLRLQENNKMPIGSKVLNRYKGNIGVYNIEQEDTNPWTVDNHNNNKIKNPYYQIGVSRFECSAYENGEY